MTADLAVLLARPVPARTTAADRLPDENVLLGLAFLRRALEHAADRSRPLAG